MTKIIPRNGNNIPDDEIVLEGTFGPLGDLTITKAQLESAITFTEGRALEGNEMHTLLVANICAMQDSIQSLSSKLDLVIQGSFLIGKVIATEGMTDKEKLKVIDHTSSINVGIGSDAPSELLKPFMDAVSKILEEKVPHLLHDADE